MTLQLEIGGTRVTVSAGETVIGSDPGCGLHLAGAGVLPQHLVLVGTAEGAAVRLATPEAAARVNGVRLGSDPVPLLHGDKVELAGQELLVVDSRRAGHTRVMDAAALAAVAPPAAEAAPRPIGLAGGRLVSLTDGREYLAGPEGLSLGRDAGCDVVVADDDVSRTHAEIAPTPEGYRLSDRSANGTFVNGDRIGGPRLLRVGDLIRVGNEDFRFSADQVVPEPAPVGPPPGAAARLGDTLHGVSMADLGLAPRRRERGQPLASFLVRSGALKGQRLVVHTPVANIGRAEYNDLVLPDASVSAAHAKLQRRDAVWLLADLGSTNGTVVDGMALREELPLGPGSTVKFGEVIALFEPHDEHPAATGPGTRAIPAQPAPAPAPESGPERAAGNTAAPRPAVRRPVRPPRATVPQRGNRSTLVIAGLIVVAVAIAAYLLLS